MWGEARYLLPIFVVYQEGQKHRYGSTPISKIRVDPYFTSLLAFTGRTVKYESTYNRPFSHCLCACVYRSRGALFLDNRRDFTEMGQTNFKPLILSM